MRCLRGGLLAASLRAGADEEPGGLPGELLLLPEGAGGVEERLHLRGHGAVPRREPEQHPVGLLQVRRRRDDRDGGVLGRRLHLLQHARRERLGDAPQHRLHPSTAATPAAARRASAPRARTSSRTRCTAAASAAPGRLPDADADADASASGRRAAPTTTTARRRRCWPAAAASAGDAAAALPHHRPVKPNSAAAAPPKKASCSQRITNTRQFSSKQTPPQILDNSATETEPPRI